MVSIQSILKEYWGYSTFRPLQEEIINSVLAGNDSLALLPTGGGKSICFQVPALAMDGLCLVVTPLIALMKDQVENLRRKNITAFSIHSGMSRKDVIATLKTAGNSNCKFLYVSPERLETSLFKEFLPSLGVGMIAVDEAHCISQWGYDFRPSYLKIAALREELPHVPVLALTASATSEVQQDICAKLLFRKQIIFRQSFERPNLSYSVFNVQSKINKISDILEKVKGTAIVYCRSRRKTKEISDLLNMHGISSDFYHAGLPQEKRNDKQEAWLHDKIRVIVCTNAFGMGIDKPGVRAVIHADVPESLENYYQEAGRAGRDGKRSYAVLLAAANEMKTIEDSIEKKFPNEEEIRKVYKSLMNHLQIPAGMGEGKYYEMDAAAFIQQFNLESATVLSAMKTLEQEELLYFNEQVYTGSKVQVIAPRERMFEFEKEHTAFELLLKTILRTYEGVIDHSVIVNEKSLASILKSKEADIVEGLQYLHRHGIIQYTQRKEKPQVYLFQNRVISDDLKINMERYLLRKNQFVGRIKAMSTFLYEKNECRSVMIARYFGDDKVKRCGICDNCINQRKQPLSGNQFEELNGNIEKHLKLHSYHLKDLHAQIPSVSLQNLKEVIDFLLAEQKIVVSETGEISLKDAALPAASS
jgi:ATP-dependent DNA helicase RecQ